MKKSPDLVIFRIPDDSMEVGPTFVCFRIVDGELENTGRIFTIPDDDSYYAQMKFTQVVIAEEVDGGSRDLAWYTIFDEDDNEQVVHEMIPDQASELQEIVLELVEEYMEEPDSGPTLH